MEGENLSLSDQKGKIKNDSSFTNWKNIIYSALQGSILGLPIFYIFLCDFFLFLPDIDTASYTNDNSNYTVNKSTIEVLRDIKATSHKLFIWFQNSTIKTNPDNLTYRYLLTGHRCLH